VAAHRPIRHARRLHCPMLTQIAERDAVVSASAARRAAAGSRGRAELIAYSIEHFAIYRGADGERATRDQLRFLERHPATASSSRSGKEPAR